MQQKMWIWHGSFSCEVDLDVPAGPGAGGGHQALPGHAAERAGLDGCNHQGGCQSKGSELNAARNVTNTTRRQIRLAIWKEFNYFPLRFLPFLLRAGLIDRRGEMDARDRIHQGLDIEEWGSSNPDLSVAADLGSALRDIPPNTFTIRSYNPFRGPCWI